MEIKPRRMKKYTPRRRKHSKDLQKQQLIDFEHLLNMDLGSFLILAEEGTEKQVQQAKIKMRSHFLKYSGEMEKIARDVGGNHYELVRTYLQSLNRIVHDGSNQVDPAPVKEHYKISENLHRLLTESAPKAA